MTHATKAAAYATAFGMKCKLCFSEQEKRGGAVQTILHDYIDVAIDVFAIHKHHAPAAFPVKTIGFEVGVKDAFHFS